MTTKRWHTGYFPHKRSAAECGGTRTLKRKTLPGPRVSGTAFAYQYKAKKVPRYLTVSNNSRPFKAEITPDL